MKKNEKEKTVPEKLAPQSDKGFFDKYGAVIVLTVLIIYVILLAIGTLAEVFKIQSILDWWIWRPW